MNERLDRKEFGARLEMLVNSARVTHKELADSLGVDRSTVTGWVRGHRTPGLEQLLAICDYFGVPITHFIGEPVEIVRFHDPESNEAWQDTSEEVRRDVEAFFRFRHEQELKKRD